MWADNETPTDLLGFAVHKDLLLRLVTDEQLLPVTVGVFGDWGGGKSSVLRMLRDSLEESERDDVACLSFNGWTFEGYDDAKAALLSSILIQLGEHKRLGPKVRDKVVPLLKRVDLLRVLPILRRGVAPLSAAALHGAAAVGLIDPQAATLAAGVVPIVAAAALGGSSEGDGGSASDDSDAQGDTESVDWQKLLREDKSKPGVLDLRTFRRDFERLLSETNLKSLVVVIDDLDRCTPERLIENLEAIKLFLMVPRTAFVIAADHRMVRYAIRKRYGDARLANEQSAASGPYDLITDYLEKLIQVPYHLPKLSPSEVESYITLLFCELHLRGRDGFETVRLACEAARKKNLYVTFGAGAARRALGPSIPEALERSLQWTSSVAQPLAEGLKGNPRQVKRFLNALLLRRQLADVASLDIRDDVLVKLMLLEYTEQELFDQLYVWHARSAGTPPELAEMERTARAKAGLTTAGESSSETMLPTGALPGWQRDRPQAWLRLDPPLADVDLRDYLWVARDRLTAVVTGLTMLSPFVRTLFNRLVDKDPGDRLMAARDAAALAAGEGADLLRMLGEHLERQPADEAGLEAFKALVEVGVAGALDTLLGALGRLPASAVGPNIPYELQTLAGNYPTSAQAITQILQAWRPTATGAGAAAGLVLTDMAKHRAEDRG